MVFKNIKKNCSSFVDNKILIFVDLFDIDLYAYFVLYFKSCLVSQSVVLHSLSLEYSTNEETTAKRPNNHSQNIRTFSDNLGEKPPLPHF